jgi:hypothetical protein
VSIILRNNSLRTQIPHQLIQFEKLQLFDISSNEIFGNIASFVFPFPFLQHLSGFKSIKWYSFCEYNQYICNSSLTFVDILHKIREEKLPSCNDSRSLNRTIVYSSNFLSTRSFSDQHLFSYCRN